jgi:hypothetical protein
MKFRRCETSNLFCMPSNKCLALKLTFIKTDVFFFVFGVLWIDQYYSVLTCKKGELPLIYLDIHVDKVRIKNKNWGRAENKMENKLGCWQGKLLALSGRRVLANSSLSSTSLPKHLIFWNGDSIPLYIVSFYELPVGVRKKVRLL